MNTVSIWLVVAMVLPVSVAAVVYLVFFPWRRTREGWAFATVITSFAALIDFAVLYQFVPHFPGKPWVKVIVYTLILVGLVQLAVSLTWQVWQARRQRRNHTH